MPCWDTNFTPATGQWKVQWRHQLFDLPCRQKRAQYNSTAVQKYCWLLTLWACNSTTGGLRYSTTVQYNWCSTMVQYNWFAVNWYRRTNPRWTDSQTNARRQTNWSVWQTVGPLFNKNKNKVAEAAEIMRTATGESPTSRHVNCKSFETAFLFQVQFQLVLFNNCCELL